MLDLNTYEFNKLQIIKIDDISYLGVIKKDDNCITVEDAIVLSDNFSSDVDNWLREANIDKLKKVVLGSAQGYRIETLDEELIIIFEQKVATLKRIKRIAIKLLENNLYSEEVSKLFPSKKKSESNEEKKYHPNHSIYRND